MNLHDMNFQNKQTKQLLPPVQSVPFTTKVESLNPDNAGVYSIRHYICQGLAAGQLFFPVSSSNKTGCHNINEILLKVVFYTITLTTL
jgi:hypothetical protein